MLNCEGMNHRNINMGKGDNCKCVKVWKRLKMWIVVKSIIYICLALPQICKFLKCSIREKSSLPIVFFSWIVKILRCAKQYCGNHFLTHSWPSLDLQIHLLLNNSFNSQINSVAFLESSTDIFQKVKSFIMQTWAFVSEVGKGYALCSCFSVYCNKNPFNLFSAMASNLRYLYQWIHHFTYPLCIVLACYQVLH